MCGAVAPVTSSTACTGNALTAAVQEEPKTVNELIGIELSADGKRIVVQTDNSFREKDFIKQVPGTVFRKEDDAWSCPLSWPACHAFRGVFAERLILGPRITAWAQAELEQWITPALQLRASTDWPGVPEEFPHQRVGTAWLQTVRYGLIADEMRTGKTVQAVCALQQLADKQFIQFTEDDSDMVSTLDGPILVVCPNGVRRVWKRHIDQWAPSLRAEVMPKTPVARRKVFAQLDAGEIDTVIINWEALRLHSRLSGFGTIRLEDKDLEVGELNRHWSVVIADEVHRAKDPTSKQTRALWACSADADYRWAFSGTPIANSPDDLWAIWHFLYPAEMPGKTRYVERYCLSSYNPFGGLTITGLNPLTEAELRKSLNVRMLRRTQAEVWEETPDVSYEVRYVELSTKERKAYESMLEDLVAELETGGEVVAWNPITKTTRLLQLASASLERIPEGAKCSKCDGTGMDPEDQDHMAPCFRCQGSGLVDRFDVCEPSSKLDEFHECLIDLGWTFTATGNFAKALNYEKCFTKKPVGCDLLVTIGDDGASAYSPGKD